MLEDYIEIKSEAPLVIPEENTIVRVGGVGVNLKRIKVVGDVEPAD